MELPPILQFVPFTSSVNPSFWHKFTEIKLDIDKLSESSRSIWGYYSNFSLEDSKSNTAFFEIDSMSFNKENNQQNFYLPARGVLMNKNLIEDFKSCDKDKILNESCKEFWRSWDNEELFNDPSLLNMFFVLSFADLKKFNYIYWFGFPSPQQLLVRPISVKSLSDEFKNEELCQIYNEYALLDVLQKTFFIVKRRSSVMVRSIKDIKELTSTSELDDYWFAFSDPSNLKEHPGWPLRNYIYFILYNCPFLIGKDINFLSLRLHLSASEVSCARSRIFKLCVNSLPDESAWIGWEKNKRGKFGPQMACMKNSIDPKALAETSVDLNLKLMKWQVAPKIDLEKVKRSKCLLLGAGTLGCSVARTLLGWGVREITFVDNGNVSYSNPVRQSLYTYEDCSQSKSKAEAAADNLAKIFPGVKSKSYKLCIPMPGHPVGESLIAQTKEDVTTLVDLISTHDIIFLLLDSREGRWLPTLLGTYHKKIVINAALGFDTYLVMRHGIASDVEDEPCDEPPKGFKVIQGNKLGCYFCNDVTAPGNSLAERTLDQQCTVSRPGLSAIAGALATELAISILQHPKGVSAPAFYKAGRDAPDDDFCKDECILGILPHSIRGFLSTFSNVLPATEKYKQCVACSDFIIREYEEKGLEFLFNVFDSCKNLELITGLSEIHKDIPDLEDLNLDSEESE